MYGFFHRIYCKLAQNQTEKADRSCQRNLMCETPSFGDRIGLHLHYGSFQKEVCFSVTIYSLINRRLKPKFVNKTNLSNTV